MSQTRFFHALALVGLLLVAPAAGAQERGAAVSQAAYAQACARCHTDPRAIGGRVTRLEDPARRAALERFLARHHTQDVAARAAIVAWLAEVTR
jgi:hypothetical protein